MEIASPDSALIGDFEAQRIAEIARAIPDIGDVFGFECRLDADDRTVDLGICVRRRPPRSAVEDRAAFVAGTRPYRSGDVWHRLREFLAVWSDQYSTLNGWIPFIFLEFDASGPRETMPVPSVFVSLDEPLEHLPDGLERKVAIITESLQRLRGQPLDTDVGHVLRDCVCRLPAGGRVVHAGVMLGREPAVLRLSVALPRSALRIYLTSVEWPAAIDVAERALDLCEPRTCAVHLEFNVARTLGPALGVVIAADRPEGWDDLLGRLVLHGLCAPHKRDALVSWPGDEVSTIGHARFLVRRMLSHVKITGVTPDSLAAKAYFTGVPCSTSE